MTHMMDQDFFDWYWQLPVSSHKMVKCTDHGQTCRRPDIPVKKGNKMAGQQTTQKRGDRVGETGE